MTNQPRPRNIANDILDAVETATSKWTRQKKSEEKHPGMVRYRASRMTKEPRTSQKEAAWQIMEKAYMAASGNNTLPAMARQIFYQARPRIMALTDDKELAYGYFSQVLLPDYIEENGVDWDVVYDARGHLEEPHTNLRIGVGTMEIRGYLQAMKEPRVIDAEFDEAGVSTRGPAGNISAVLFIEKEGFGPLFKAVNLADRHDLMIISTKGVSVTAARRLLDEVCGGNDIPLLVLHDFDIAGFMIFGTLRRDTRRYAFANGVEPIDLGLRLGDIEGLEQEPAAATKTNVGSLRRQLSENGATPQEVEFLLNNRVELNAMASDQLIELIERKLGEHGIRKVVPDKDLLGDAYQAFHRSKQLRDIFNDAESEFEETETEIDVPKNLETRVRKILKKHNDLRWDDAVKVVLDETQLDHVRRKKKKGKAEAGNFAADDDDSDEKG
jgi:Topoisomerase 6 subunit A/Spo11, Toprim domain